jgi:hypothetical protein
MINPADGPVRRHPPQARGKRGIPLLLLAFSTLGVVYGDIGGCSVPLHLLLRRSARCQACISRGIKKNGPRARMHFRLRRHFPALRFWLHLPGWRA